MPEMTSYAPGPPAGSTSRRTTLRHRPASTPASSAGTRWRYRTEADTRCFSRTESRSRGAAVNQSGGPAAWNTYIATADADATAARITAAGGTLMVDVMDILDAGRMAFARDPQGVPFGIWQPGTHTGAQIVNEPFAYTWAELNTTDAGAAQSFYSDVFGWEPESARGRRGLRLRDAEGRGARRRRHHGDEGPAARLGASTSPSRTRTRRSRRPGGARRLDVATGCRYRLRSHGDARGSGRGAVRRGHASERFGGVEATPAGDDARPEPGRRASRRLPRALSTAPSRPGSRSGARRGRPRSRARGSRRSSYRRER